MIIRSKCCAWQADATDCRHVEDATQAPASAFGELGLPFPFPTLLHLDIQPGRGDCLISALKARHISFRSQDRHGLVPEFWYAPQPFCPIVRVEEVVDLAFELGHVGLRMLELIT